MIPPAEWVSQFWSWLAVNSASLTGLGGLMGIIIGIPSLIAVMMQIVKTRKELERLRAQLSDSDYYRLIGKASDSDCNP